MNNLPITGRRFVRNLGLADRLKAATLLAICQQYIPHRGGFADALRREFAQNRLKDNPVQSDEEFIVERVLTEEQKARKKAQKKAYYQANRERQATWYKAWCNANREHQKAYRKAYYQAHREQAVTESKAWRETNPDRKAATDKAWREANPERKASINKAWREANHKRKVITDKAWQEANHERISAYREKNKLRVTLGKTLANRLKRHGKSASTMEIIGCDKAWLWTWLEKHFKPGMTRENYGPVWHIDHIRPCASFDLSDPKQQKLCWHWTNLQPLFASENKSKGNKWCSK